MKFTFKGFCHQKSDDIWEDIPEKRSIPRTILDLLLSPTYHLPRTVNTVRIYKDRTASPFALVARRSSSMSTSLTAAVVGSTLIGRNLMIPKKSSSGGMV